MRIIRHQIAITDQQWVQLPAGGELLSVAQARTDANTTIDLWSLDVRRGRPVEVEVFIIGTGNPITDAAQEAMLMGKFLGTVVCPNGLVWHVVQGQHR